MENEAMCVAYQYHGPTPIKREIGDDQSSTSLGRKGFNDIYCLMGLIYTKAGKN